MVKSRLISRNRIPYGGLWNTKDRLTGVEINAVTFDQVISKVIKARQVAGIPVGLGLEDEVEQWLCQDHPDEAEHIDPDIPKRRKLTLSDVVNGTKVMVAFKLGGSKVVSQEEVTRRVNICLRCPMNSGFQKPCSGICAELKDVVLNIVGDRPTPNADKLHACGICACFLQAAVWLPLETQCVGVDEEMKKKFAYMKESANCWKQCT